MIDAFGTFQSILSYYLVPDRKWPWDLWIITGWSFDSACCPAVWSSNRSKTSFKNKESCMRKVILGVSAFFLLAGAMSAQTVDEIIAKNNEAKGGLAKMKAVQTMRITGNAEFGAMQAGIVLTQKRAN